MASNKYKIQDKSKKKGLFARIERLLNIDEMFENGLPIRYLPYIAFTTVLIIAYIGYNHYADKATRDIIKLEVEVEDLRADYTTLKANYMYSRLQSEVVKRVKTIGLEENSNPPYKIVVPEDEY